MRRALHRHLTRYLLSSAALAGIALSSAAPALADGARPIDQISHIIVIYEENRSFDGVMGFFPGATGLSRAAGHTIQVDQSGVPYTTLPPVMNTNFSPAIVDTRFPPNLPNAPFDIANPGQGYPGVPQNVPTGDLVHRYYQEQIQIDGGKMDKFATISDAKGLSMGHYDLSTNAAGTGPTELYSLAQRFTLADNFFHAAFGGSFLNHFWLICACSPVYDYSASSNSTFTLPADSSLRAVINSSGALVTDGSVTPATGSTGPQPKGDFAINTTRSIYLHAPSNTSSTNLLPPQTMPNIGDRLDAAGVSWAWYGEGYKAAMAGTPDPLFQFHHQAFAYFANNAPDTAHSTSANTTATGPLTGAAVGNATTEAHREAHLKDYDDLIAAIDGNTLEKVAFYKPIGKYNLHPGYADVTDGDARLQDLIENHILNNPAYDNAIVVITFDEHGGAWDHVPPPTAAKGGNADVWGPGSRVPTLIISKNLAKKGYIDHTPYDTTAILKLIEDRFQVAPLGTRDAAANSLTRSMILP